MKSIADYQTTLGGVDPVAIIGHLKGKGEILRFDKRNKGIRNFAFILDKMVKSQNTFQSFSENHDSCYRSSGIFRQILRWNYPD